MSYRLDQLFELQMGKTPARANPSYWNGTNKWVSISDLSGYDKYVTDTKECISDLGVSESGIKVVPKNTVIMSFKLSIGKTAITTEDVYTNEAIMAFIDKGVCEINTDYLYYLFSGTDWNKGTNKAVLGLTLNKATLSKKEIDIPDLHTQNEVIKKLDALSNVIHLQKLSLDKLDELIKSRFVEMFGDPAINPYNWQSLKIQDAVAVKPQNGLYKPQSDYVEDNSGVPILRIDGFYNGKVVDYRNLKRLICTKEEFDKYQLVENDIVINRVNSLDYLGKCARISGLIEGTVYESNMMRMHFIDERFNPIYLTFLLCSEYTYDQIISHAKKAVNQASINQQDVLDFNIFEPPIDLQNQFADFVTQVEKQKATVQQSIDKLETLKKSLMQEYFG